MDSAGKRPTPRSVFAPLAAPTPCAFVLMHAASACGARSCMRSVRRRGGVHGVRPRTPGMGSSWQCADGRTEALPKLCLHQGSQSAGTLAGRRAGGARACSSSAEPGAGAPAARAAAASSRQAAPTAPRQAAPACAQWASSAHASARLHRSRGSEQPSRLPEQRSPSVSACSPRRAGPSVPLEASAAAGPGCATAAAPAVCTSTSSGVELAGAGGPVRAPPSRRVTRAPSESASSLWAGAPAHELPAAPPPCPADAPGAAAAGAPAGCCCSWGGVPGRSTASGGLGAPMRAAHAPASLRRASASTIRWSSWGSTSQRAAIAGTAAYTRAVRTAPRPCARMPHCSSACTPAPPSGRAHTRVNLCELAGTLCCGPQICCRPRCLSHPPSSHRLCCSHTTEGGHCECSTVQDG
jgi:hypothetical protein